MTRWPVTSLVLDVEHVPDRAALRVGSDHDLSSGLVELELRVGEEVGGHGVLVAPVVVEEVTTLRSYIRLGENYHPTYACLYPPSTSNTLLPAASCFCLSSESYMVASVQFG